MLTNRLFPFIYLVPSKFVDNLKNTECLFLHNYNTRPSSCLVADDDDDEEEGVGKEIQIYGTIFEDINHRDTYLGSARLGFICVSISYVYTHQVILTRTRPNPTSNSQRR